MKTERLIIFIILITALLVPQTILAQEKQGMQMGGDHGQMMSHPEMMDDHMKVHHEHIQTMERVFRYERNISGRADDIRVGYLYKDGDADSEKDKDAMVMMAKTMVEKGMAGKSISFIPIGVSSDKDQDSLLAKEKVNVIYLGRGLTDAEFNAAKNYAGNEKILTIGSTGAQAEAGITAVGIVVQPEKVNLIINLITAGEQGADFDPRLFRLADKVIK
ncbi:MAG: YfiR family protein [Deltaproteobacteria bacterium]|nr:MAG: YfiR family protein [Deltaproteobacteria bacterium]